MDAFKSLLKQYWGYDDFRGNQQDVVHCSAVQKKDCIVIMPTGSGKSICYQIAALASDGLCIVVCPLIALMQDQVMQLKKRGITAIAVHAGLQPLEIKKSLQLAADGRIKFLYVSPERIQTKLFQDYVENSRVNLIAVDEAHCIVQWGYDFRPAYLEIKTLRELFPQSPIMALTASATQSVRLDIAKQLNLRDGVFFTQSYARPRLSYSVFACADKMQKLLTILKNVPHSALVYCATRRQCENITKILIANKIQADYYHAGIEHNLRNKKQADWVANKIIVIVCTNAFGMGIDKADVRVVVHYEMPNSLEYYYQEAGRAGRDEKKAFAVLLYNDLDIQFLQKKLREKYPPMSIIKKVYSELNNYYKIAIGKGEGISFDFNIEGILLFLKDLEVGIILGAIDILKQFKIISIIENPRLPARIFMSCNKNYFIEFQKNVPALSNFLDYIVRNVDGVWHETSNIYLDVFAKKLKCSESEVHRKLLILERAEVLQFYPAVMNAQIVFEINRIGHLESYINLIELKKKEAEDTIRLQKMLNFAQQFKTCRSTFIANYFEDTKSTNCGICDNCLKKNKLKLKPQALHLLKETILLKIANGAKDKASIEKNMQQYSIDDINEMLYFLVQENVITYDNSHHFFLKK